MSQFYFRKEFEKTSPTKKVLNTFFALTVTLNFGTVAALSADAPSSASGSSTTTPANTAAPTTTSTTTTTQATTTPAATTTATPAATPAATGTDSSSSSSSPPLQAGVQMIELNLQTLNDIGLDIKYLLKAADSLYDEVTIQPVTIMTQPEVIGRGIIIQVPIGTQPAGPPAPPRKARLDMAMSQMRPIVTTLKKDVDEFESGHKRVDISDDARADLHPLFEDWVKIVTDISSHLDTLETLTKGPSYDNSSIAQGASIIHTDVKSLDEVRRKIYKYLQKEGKKKKQKNA